MKIERIERWAVGFYVSRDAGMLMAGRWAIVFWKPDYLA